MRNPRATNLRNFGFVAIGIVLLLNLVVMPRVAHAQDGSPDQAIELAGNWDRGEPVFKLVYQGYVKGCQKGSNDKDHKYRINFGSAYGPFHPGRIYLLPHNSSARKTIESRGGTLSGYNLDDRNNAYLCIGALADIRGLNSSSLSLFHDQ